jgi:plastocyanin
MSPKTYEDHTTGAGTYRFVCLIHTLMRRTVVVR